MSPQSDVRASRIIALLMQASQDAKRSPDGSAYAFTVTSALTWLQTGDCEGSMHHSPSPLLIRPYYLSAAVDEVLGAPAREGDDLAQLVYLCSTCRDNLTVYLSLLYAYSGAPPLAAKRDFGNIIRHLGDRAWAHWDHAAPV